MRLALSAGPLLALFGGMENSQQAHAASPQCRIRGIPGQTVYRIGMLDVRGTAYEANHLVFEDYLTATAGAVFEDPQFQLVPIAFSTHESIYDTFQKAAVDFVFAQPAVFTCLDVEQQLRPLATRINRRTVGGVTYEVNEFAGLMIARADRADLQTVADVRGQRTGCVSINGFGSGLMQFRELVSRGIHYLQDVAQVIFMNNQPNIVNAVLRGDIDVGYIRTDQLERTIDERTGDLVDPKLFKILEAVPGSDYPFAHTTPLFPDFTFGALPHVPDVVTRHVEDALTRIHERAAPAEDLLQCYQTCDANGGGIVLFEDQDCQAVCRQEIESSIEACDTTPELALLAHRALAAAQSGGFSEPPSLAEIRTMLESTGLLHLVAAPQSNETVAPGDSASGGQIVAVGTVSRCIRSTNLAEAVVCPEGFVKLRDTSIHQGCKRAGLDCYGFECLCSPCVEASAIEFYPVPGDGEQVRRDQGGDDAGLGCGKFAVCGQVSQQSAITLRAMDHSQRYHESLQVHVWHGNETTVYPMERVTEESTGRDWFELTYTDTAIPVGDVILQVFEGEDRQIENSPYRLRIVARDCAADTNDALRIPDATGNCVCQSQSVSLFEGAKCVPYSTLLPGILLPLLTLLVVGIYFYLQYKRKQMDSIWKVTPAELSYQDPPRVLGRGTFGMVLLAEYRGTQVAVKRALPPSEDGAGTTNTGATSNQHRFDFISGDATDGTEADKSRVTADPEQGLQSTSNLGTKSFAIGFASGRKSLLGSKSSKPTNNNGSSRVLSRLWPSMNSRQYEKLKENFKYEMRMLAKLRHPCITTVMGAVLEKTVEPLMIMEYMELGSLYDLLHNDSMVLEGDVLLPILQDIARGMRFLHSAKPQIVHGDLKAANVLVDSRFRAKVADFGLSTKRAYHKSAVGTPFWMAPELLRKESHNTAASDVYSFGVVLYEVITRKDPYEGEDHRQVLEAIADRKVRRRPSTPQQCTKSYARLMQDCWIETPRRRPAAEWLDTRLKAMKPQDVAPVCHIKEKERQELQTNMNKQFPRRIAVALKRGERVEPQTLDSASVFYADIVNLPKLTELTSAEKTLDMMDRLYSKCDALCEKHGVLKVETVGDAYMAVANVDADQPSHADIMARFAVEVIQVASETLVDSTDISLGHVPLRAGIHVGPVATHVLGSRNPKFSIVGETVSMAVTMARRSNAGRVQCSEEAGAMLAAQRKKGKITYVLMPRGQIKYKGQQSMKTFWVQSLYYRAHHNLSSVVERDDSEESANDTDRDTNQLNLSTRTTTSTCDDASSETCSPMKRASRQAVLAPVYDYLKNAPVSA